MSLSGLLHSIWHSKRQPAMTEEEMAACIAGLDDALLAKLAVDFIGHAREQVTFRASTRLKVLADRGLTGARDIVTGRAMVDTAEGLLCQLKAYNKEMDWIGCPQAAIIGEAMQSVLQLIQAQENHSKPSEVLANVTVLVAQVARGAVAVGPTGEERVEKRQAEGKWQHERWVQTLAQARLSYARATAPLPTERSRRSLLAR